MPKQAPQGGFSLIELMISVSLIGILISVAVPQYRGFQARARQVEAKIELSTIYKLEKIWFAESGGYTCALDGIGYSPQEVNTGVARGYYLRGFPLTMCLGDVNPPSGGRGWWEPSEQAGSRPSAEAISSGADYCCQHDPLIPPTFRAVAWGSIKNSSTELDGWSMNAEGSLERLELPQP
ncbi:MAG: type IV pilin protein [Oligoflexia bacterium]